MLRYSFFVIFLGISFTSFAQFFSGELQYKTSIVSKDKRLNADSILAQKPGTSSSYLITRGYYKSTYYKEGKTTYSYTYHGDTKRMYDERFDQDGLVTYRDSRKGNALRIRSILYKDSIKIILGHPCFMVERVYENYIAKTYYATDLIIDAESFKDHQVGDWYNQIKEVGGALSLSSVYEYATHIEINEVTSIASRNLTASDFELPKKKLVVASSDALDVQAELRQPSQETIICYREKLIAAAPSVKQDYISYVGLVVTEIGEIKNIEPYEKDQFELYKVACDIIAKCGLEFTPGQIDGKSVNSFLYFPIEFKQVK